MASPSWSTTGAARCGSWSARPPGSPVTPCAAARPSASPASSGSTPPAARPAATGSTFAARSDVVAAAPHPRPRPRPRGPPPAPRVTRSARSRAAHADRPACGHRGRRHLGRRAVGRGPAALHAAGRVRRHPRPGAARGPARRPWDARSASPARSATTSARPSWAPTRRRSPSPRVPRPSPRPVGHAPLAAGARWELVVAVGTVTALRRSATSWRGELRLADGSRLPIGAGIAAARARLALRDRQPGGRHRHRPTAGHRLRGRAALRDAPRPLGPRRPPARDGVRGA